MKKEAGFLKMVPEGSSWKNEVAARIFLRVVAYRPIVHAPRIQCPLLVCVAKKDYLAPAKSTIQAAKKAPRGELKIYPLKHFEVYVGEAFEQVIADQIEFLRKNLLTRKT